MRSLADGFRASDDFGGKGWSELRLLPTPIARYGEPGTKLLDGALFAFVLGTDPEVFLFLEARPGQGRLRVAVCPGAHDRLRGQRLIPRQGRLGASRPASLVGPLQAVLRQSDVP